MRTKFLLFLALFSFGAVLFGQDTIRTLIISEARMDNNFEVYFELTNIGETTLNLSQFEFGTVHPWTSRVDTADINKWFNVGSTSWFMLPDWELEPGKSIVIAKVDDWWPKMAIINPDKYGGEHYTKPEMLKLADIKIHIPESPVQPIAGDSVTPYNDIVQQWQGRSVLYIRHHVAPGDSVVVDQVGGVFRDALGQQSWGGKDVAGVTRATEFDVLVRKHSVLHGQIDFDHIGRGGTLAESEWIPVPFLSGGGWEPDRAVFWTVGNHVDAKLSDLESNTMDIDLVNSTLTVPWGVRHDDSIMYQFVRKPGFAWHYDYAAVHEDSAFVSVRNNDILTVYACGDTLQKKAFTIIAAAPTTDANLVIPKKVKNSRGFYNGSGPFCVVTDGVPGIDTIKGSALRGIAYATRVDTLFKYLEKAPNASWEIVWVDGNERTDLKNGDKLKVTAENNSVKEYFIKVDQYRPSHNAYLGSITWPDIPDDYRDYYGWVQDTIPAFANSKYEYMANVPVNVVGIPALVAKTQNLNAKVTVNRATSLTGSEAARTVTFTSTAEDDTSILVYKVQLIKDKNEANVQHWKGEPFFSQYTWRQDYNNDLLEIVNPGTDPLDLSHYMLTFSAVSTPADAITSFSTNSASDWGWRYLKYIPGRKWKDLAGWSVDPAVCEQDLNVPSVVLPGDVFVVEWLQTHGDASSDFVAAQMDVDFAKSSTQTALGGTIADRNHTIDGNWYWCNNKIILWKILNDSVYSGLKPASDANDFEVIDMWGYENAGSNWVVGGRGAGQQVVRYIRKPEIYKGNPDISTGVDTVGSFGSDETNSEWLEMNEARLQTAGFGWPAWRYLVSDGIGSHFMNAVTIYKSTVGSVVYKVSEGYSKNESLRGVVSGTTVTDFEDNLIKANAGQTLFVKNSTNGDTLAADGVVLNGDTLIVVSADAVNTSKYLLTVTDEGLSSDAVLTTTEPGYVITHSGEAGTVEGFDYGTALKDVVENVIVPEGASMTVIDNNDAFVPLKHLNFDTAYVNTTATDRMFFEVIAENGTTKIVYQLTPNSSSSDAYVTSDVYQVDQDNSLIDFVPPGTTVAVFERYLTPAPGATMKLYDKFGFERTLGYVVRMTNWWLLRKMKQLPRPIISPCWV